MLAAHSFGGLYALTFAARYPEEVAGMVLVDSTAPTSAAKPSATPPSDAGSDDLTRRVSALVSTLGRLGVGRLVGVPTASHLRSTIDEGRARNLHRRSWKRSDCPRANRSWGAGPGRGKLTETDGPAVIGHDLENHRVGCGAGFRMLIAIGETYSSELHAVTTTSRISAFHIRRYPARMNLRGTVVGELACVALLLAGCGGSPAPAAPIADAVEVVAEDWIVWEDGREGASSQLLITVRNTSDTAVAFSGDGSFSSYTILTPSGDPTRGPGSNRPSTPTARLSAAPSILAPGGEGYLYDHFNVPPQWGVVADDFASYELEIIAFAAEPQNAADTLENPRAVWDENLERVAISGDATGPEVRVDVLVIARDGAGELLGIVDSGARGERSGASAWLCCLPETVAGAAMVAQLDAIGR